MSAGSKAERQIQGSGDQPLQLDDLQRIGERTLRVRLLSRPQAMQAPTMARVRARWPNWVAATTTK